MKEIQVIKYQAEDGTIFNTEEECLEYEKELSQVKEIMNLIPVVKKICAENEDCSYCPFHRNFKCCFGYNEDVNSEYAPCNWSI
jgi:hypothetical protein